MSSGQFSQGVWGFETAGAGIKAGTMYGIRYANLMMKPKGTPEVVGTISSRGQKQKMRILKWDGPLSFNTQLGVDDIARWRAHHQGFPVITNPAAGVYDWTIRDLLPADSLASDLSSISFEGDRDDSYAQLNLGFAQRELKLTVKANKIIDMSMSGDYTRMTHLNDPVFTGGAGTSYAGTLYIRGNRLGADGSDTTHNLIGTIVTPGATGVATIKWQINATAGAIVTVVQEGTWQDVVLANGTYAGDSLDPVQFLLSTDANPFVAGDSWSINAKRTRVANPTYSTRNPLTGVAARFTVGSTVYDVEDFELTFIRPIKYRRGTSSKWPLSRLPDGIRTFQIKFTRDYFDRDFYQLFLSSAPVAFQMVARGDLLATVANVSYYETWTLTSTNMQASDAGADVSNDKQIQEVSMFEPYFDGTNVDMSEVVRCSLSTLT